jgi:hypothetical protein
MVEARRQVRDHRPIIHFHGQVVDTRLEYLRDVEHEFGAAALVLADERVIQEYPAPVVHPAEAQEGLRSRGQFRYREFPGEPASW